MNKLNFLDKIGKFYFGIGGCADLLFILSSMIKDNNNTQKYSLIFWASQDKLIREFIEPFKDHLNNVIIFHGWQSKEDFDAIVSHKNFISKVHIPDNLDFINEWTKNTKKYRQEIQSPFLFLNNFNNQKTNTKNITGLGLWGSKTELWKRRRLSQDETDNFIANIMHFDNDKEFWVFGSQEDKQEFTIPVSDNIKDYRGLDIKYVFSLINQCNKFISVDTWFKTWTGLKRIPTTIVKSQYSVDLSSMFPNSKDPSDNIFLENWNFKFLDLTDEIFKQKLY